MYWKTPTLPTAKKAWMGKSKLVHDLLVYKSYHYWMGISGWNNKPEALRVADKVYRNDEDENNIPRTILRQCPICETGFGGQMHYWAWASTVLTRLRSIQLLLVSESERCIEGNRFSVCRREVKTGLADLVKKVTLDYLQYFNSRKLAYSGMQIEKNTVLERIKNYL